jgi:hypothetical protein
VELNNGVEKVRSCYCINSEPAYSSPPGGDMILALSALRISAGCEVNLAFHVAAIALAGFGFGFSFPAAVGC